MYLEGGSPHHEELYWRVTALERLRITALGDRILIEEIHHSGWVLRCYSLPCPHFLLPFCLLVPAPCLCCWIFSVMMDPLFLETESQ